MTTGKQSSSESNPFVDPIMSLDGRPSFADSTIVIGKASLTLATNELIVLDEAFSGKRDRSNCCGLFPSSGTANTLSIPFQNVLWAELLTEHLQLTINYAAPISKTEVRAKVLTYTIEPIALDAVNTWVSRLLQRAYGQSQQRKRIKVLVNPNSGQGNAVKLYDQDAAPLLQAARCQIDMTRTAYRGEATEIAQQLDIEAFDVVAAVSGDGLPHEIFNGLGKRPDAKKALAKVAVVNIPGGSGNAMSWNLNGTASASLATLAIIKGIRTPLDLVSITQGETRTLSFLSQAVGIVAECDLATEHIRWMGEQRFTYGFLTRLIAKAKYPCDIAVKVAIEDKAGIKKHYRQEMNNYESESERRGYKHLLDDDASASSGDDEGLPPLRYGTINDKLPEGWELISHDNLINFYCGNMAYMASDANFFPGALPNDGYMDLFTTSTEIGRINSLKIMVAVGNETFFDMPSVKVQKILGYRLIPKQKSGYISIDGERIPFAPYQTEVHKGLGTVLTKSGHLYEAKAI